MSFVKCGGVEAARRNVVGLDSAGDFRPFGEFVVSPIFGRGGVGNALSTGGGLMRLAEEGVEVVGSAMV